MSDAESSADLSFRGLLLRVSETSRRVDPWSLPLKRIRGRIGTDAVERISTEAIFEFLDVPRTERGSHAAKRIRAIMVDLGWMPVRARHVVGRGWTARVRGYARYA